MEIHGGYIYPFIALFQCLDVGFTIGWSMPAGQYLIKIHPKRLIGGDPNDFVDGFTKNVLSWIFSIPGLILAILCLTCGILLKLFSPKKIIILFGFTKTISWAILLFANIQPVWYILARALLGIGYMVNFIIPLYLEEITEPDNRGFFISLCDTSLNLGVLIAYLLGSIFSFHLNLWIHFIYSLTTILLCCLLPESPIWLQDQGEPDKAIQSLKQIRSKKNDYKHELMNIEQYLQMKQYENITFCQAIILMINKRHYLKCLCIVVFLFIFQQLGGIAIMIHYAVDMTTDKDNNNLDQNRITIVTGIAALVGSILASFLSDRFGRRPLLLTSECGIIICLITLTLHSAHCINIQIIPLICVCGIVFMTNLGLGPLPCVIMAELLPCEIRAWGTSICMLSLSLIIFILLKSFYILIETLGKIWVFSMYAIFSSIGFIFILIFLPETKSIPRHLMEKIMIHGNTEIINYERNNKDKQEIHNINLKSYH